jgi:hypothetical protein
MEAEKRRRRAAGNAAQGSILAARDYSETTQAGGGVALDVGGGCNLVVGG